MTNLEKYLYQLRRIEEHRDKEAEQEIRRIYKKLLKDMQSYLADVYTKYSEDDALTYAGLVRVGMDARFLEEVELRINGITPEVSNLINTTVSQTYEACYNGMRNTVIKAVGNRQVLLTAFAKVTAATPDIIKQAVNNPIAGLTLKDTLEKNRKEIIYDIKKNIGIGLSNGDRFTTMAKRISDCLDSDYRKSIRIVRTEAHRCRESGYNDAATELNTALKNVRGGYVLAKTWKTMKDQRVRPTRLKGKAKMYNHREMDGITIAQDELFELPSGATCMCPGQSGIAAEDINCRCYLSYDLVETSKLSSDKRSNFNSTDMKDTQEYRPVNRSAYSSKELRGGKEIEVRKIENSTYSGGIYISDSVKLKPKQMHNIETSINAALKMVGGGNNVPRCMIISPSEMQTGAVCSYNAVKNIMYLNSVVADTEKLLMLQKDMACPGNPLSTYIHEFLHWKDAEKYRKKKEIANQREYLNYLRKECEKKLERLKKQGYNINDISKYATDKYVIGEYDETLTELRVKSLLESGD